MSSNENPDPYLQMLAEWEEIVPRMKALVDKEADLRRKLFAGAFPNPSEGATKNKHTLPDGRVLKGDHKINRKIDEAALPGILEAMKARGVANADQLVRYKPELAKREWNSLSEEMKIVFSPALISTPGMPGFEVIAAEE